jgi:hypothetical protein
VDLLVRFGSILRCIMGGDVLLWFLHYLMCAFVMVHGLMFMIFSTLKLHVELRCET